MKKLNIWFWVAAVATLVGAPNATVIRFAVDEADPFYWTMTRFALIAMVCLPFILASRKVFRRREARIALIKASISLTVGVLTFAFAIFHSQASYISIISLLTPIVFVVLSSRMVGERIKAKAVAGLALAASGAMLLVVLPIALSDSATGFYPLATILGLINCVAYSLGIIYLRKANEAGVSMPVTIGTTSTVIALVSLGLLVLFGDTSRMPIEASYWLAVGYSALAVGLLHRILSVLSYEHIGSVMISALGYFEIMLAILIPVFVLNEKLSPEMVVGGALILFGVYVVESHKYPHAKHHFIHRHH